ncbi:uncharacterized protein PSANT_05306 [Moesziomyces antarcticus]|uniref:Uncharacterized protein n=1 Tax=Pseudozyma antarctica TaxID=84753 RepID=A0A5C3FT63_PSEA2|nr:uncharacterized protein PSANT_05306 [Moesziomyces antarcticus]
MDWRGSRNVPQFATLCPSWPDFDGRGPWQSVGGGQPDNQRVRPPTATPLSLLSLAFRPGSRPAIRLDRLLDRLQDRLLLALPSSPAIEDCRLRTPQQFCTQRTKYTHTLSPLRTCPSATPLSSLHTTTPTSYLPHPAIPHLLRSWYSIHTHRNNFTQAYQHTLSLFFALRSRHNTAAQSTHFSVVTYTPSS